MTTGTGGRPRLPRLGLALSTVGRPALAELLRSAASSTLPPTAVVVADQSAGRLTLPVSDYPFPVEVLPSSGGVSAGRNLAALHLGGAVDLVGFPNDDTAYPPTTLQGVAEQAAATPGAVAVACTLLEEGRPRFVLPPAGTGLDRRSVWRAIEPATFVRQDAFLAAGGFREDMGAGSGSLWGSGEGTDLLLRLLGSGGTVLSRADLVVQGPGERRDLSANALVAKHRSYARGTGYVYRLHEYPWHARLRILAGPVAKALQHDPSARLSLHLAAARVVGRVEGLRGAPLGARSPGRQRQREGR